MNEPRDTEIELSRRVHLGRLLGKGGMGRVLDGFAPDLGQHLAVKMLHGEHADDPEIQARFDDEVAIMASIDHPGNLPVYGKGKDAAGNTCYVMKKVEGRTLTELLAERGREITSVPWRRRLLNVLLDAAETLAYAHGTGVVHRDIKPDNILIDRHDSVFVIDWGIAKRIGRDGGTSKDTQTLPGRVMGSPGYMSPEQAEGRSASAGPQADVFALGVILYEILTGRRPFGDTGGREEMLGIIHRDPEHPRRHNWILKRSISEVCLKALAKDPSRRYADACGLATDLRAFLEGRPPAAVRPNLIERLRYAARRRPLRAVVIASLVMASLVLAAFVGSQMWIDHRLSGKAMDRLEVIDREIIELSGETKELRRRLDAPDLVGAEHARLQNELGEIEARWLLSEIDALRLLSEAANLRFIRNDPRMLALARERLFSFIRGGIDRDHPALAAGMIDTILERHAEGTLQMELSSADIAKLEKLAAEADGLADLQSR